MKTAIVGALLGASMLMGCAAVGPNDEAVGEADALGRVQQAQIDPGDKVWSRLTLTLADPLSTPVATVYVFNRTLGDFHPGTEYWYVNVASLAKLGGYALQISATAETSETPPADPSYAREQRFTQPELVSWGEGWSRDPGRGGVLYSGPDGVSLRLMPSSNGLLDITWSQIIPSKATPRNVIPSGKFTRQEAVTVPAGHLGYSIRQTCD